MIHKLLSIKNLGKFKDFSTSRDSDWNGIFEKVNSIYAENGSGKTTFTQILKSNGTNSPEILYRRKSFKSEEDIEIKFIQANKKQLSFSTKGWNDSNPDIEIFDTYFIEENVYLISIGNYDKEGNLFELVMGDDAKRLYNEIVQLTKERKKTSILKRNLKYKIKKKAKSGLSNREISIREQIIKDSSLKIDILNKNIKKLELELFDFAETFGKEYLSKINEYLSYLNPDLILSKLNRKGNNFIYHLKIRNHDVRSDSETIPLKHTLSEGDKSALALAFFFARITVNGNLDKKIIVFDDPISSFDHNRRHVTINILTRISKQALQFFLLSHDLNFVKDFSTKVDECLNLKISFNGSSSTFKLQDIKNETLTGIFKDLTIIKNFIAKGEGNELDKREVVRCIRPVLEGFFRIKFFGLIDDSKWLGDIISLIRLSDENSVFFKYQLFLDEIIDINDYTKSYHHSSPNYLETPLNSHELKNYCSRTINLLQKI